VRSLFNPWAGYSRPYPAPAEDCLISDVGNKKEPEIPALFIL
jgi:hypothetical protein